MYLGRNDERKPNGIYLEQNKKMRLYVVNDL